MIAKSYQCPSIAPFGQDVTHRMQIKQSDPNWIFPFSIEIFCIGQFRTHIPQLLQASETRRSFPKYFAPSPSSRLKIRENHLNHRGFFWSCCFPARRSSTTIRAFIPAERSSCFISASSYRMKILAGITNNCSYTTENPFLIDNWRRSQVDPASHKESPAVLKRNTF